MCCIKKRYLSIPYPPIYSINRWIGNTVIKLPATPKGYVVIIKQDESLFEEVYDVPLYQNANVTKFSATILYQQQLKFRVQTKGNM